MQKKFELFRLSLVGRPQRDFIADGLGKDVSKEAYIRQVFSTKHVVQHRGIDLHYVPFDEKIIDPKFLGGRVGRPFSNIEHTPPELGLHEALHQGWKALTILVDPAHHDDGQKVAVEVNKAVGSSYAIINSLIERINSYSNSIYIVNCHPIIDASTFWSFANENKGQITSLSFDFAVPNMFGGHDSIQEELRKFRDIEKAQDVSVKLKSADGINTDTDKIKEAVNYVEKGGGDIVAKTKSRQTYDSKNRVKITHITIEDSDSDIVPSILREASNILRS